MPSQVRPPPGTGTSLAGLTGADKPARDCLDLSGPVVWTGVCTHASRLYSFVLRAEIEIFHRGQDGQDVFFSNFFLLGFPAKIWPTKPLLY